MKSLISEKYKALGCIVRLRIIHLLLIHKEGLFVCEIVNILQLKQYNISKHLTILKWTNLVIEEKRGKMVLYRINFNKEDENLFKSVLDAVRQEPEIFEKDIERLQNIITSRDKNNCII